MKIIRTPIEELIKYIEDLYRNQNKKVHDDIISLIDEYHCKFSKYHTIIPLGYEIMEDWCDGNWDNTMENCPNIPGIIISREKDGKREYAFVGPTCYSDSQSKTETLSYYTINSCGHIVSHIFFPEQWQCWGAPTRYFYFNQSKYIEGNDWAFGDRIITKLCFGHDVKILQSLLQRYKTSLSITGRVDTDTINILHELQALLNLPMEDKINPRSANGRILISYLTNESKDIIF